MTARGRLPQSPEVRAYLAERAERQAKIRFSQYWVAGYAAVFYRPHANGKFYTRGCFDRAIHHSLVLLHNHESGFAGAVNARTSSGTMCVSVDRVGLWFEAAVDRVLYGAIAQGFTTGVSLGASKFDINGRGITEVHGLWEISVLGGTRKPQCPQTWIRTGAQALDLRARLAQ